jgi:fructokinase
LNVVSHLSRLGYRASFLTAVGDDPLGREALDAVSRAGVDSSMVGVVQIPTGTMEVGLERADHPTYVIVSPAAYESIAVDERELARIRSAPPVAVVFGTLAQRSALVRSATRSVFLAAPEALRVYDVNLRDRTWTAPLIVELLGDATVLKLNDAEVKVLAPLLGLPAAEVLFAEAAAARYGLQAVCITRGGRGAMLWSAGACSETASVRITVVDTIGAGDAFTAGLVDGLIRGRRPSDTLATANALGAFVASRRGAIPPWTAADLAALGAVLD